jgi:hypothetical protein
MNQATRDYSSYYQALHPPSFVDITSPAEASLEIKYPPSYIQYTQSCPDYSFSITFDQQATTWQSSSHPQADWNQLQHTNAQELSQIAERSLLTLWRRKEQNKLAQRATRQRKEARVKELEEKVLRTTLKTRELEEENCNLNRELDSIASENDILRQGQVERNRFTEAWGKWPISHSHDFPFPEAAREHAEPNHDGQYFPPLIVPQLLSEESSPIASDLPRSPGHTPSEYVVHVVGLF